MTKKYYKTTVTVEILSNDYPWDGDIHSLAYDIDEGECSGFIVIDKGIELTKDQLELECQKHGTDIEFFTGQLDEFYDIYDEFNDNCDYDLP